MTMVRLLRKYEQMVELTTMKPSWAVPVSIWMSKALDALVSEALDDERAERGQPTVCEVDAKRVQRQAPSYRFLKCFHHLVGLVAAVPGALVRNSMHCD